MTVALASSSAAPYAVPSLKYYFTPTTFRHDVSRACSRPGSSSSNESYAPEPARAPAPHTSPFYIALAPEHSSHASSPSGSACSSPMSRLNRPLPTPPTTPQSMRDPVHPRPLPRPPIHRTQSHETLRTDPLPAPPASAPQTHPEQPVASSSKLPVRSDSLYPYPSPKSANSTQSGRQTPTYPAHALRDTPSSPRRPRTADSSSSTVHVSPSSSSFNTSTPRPRPQPWPVAPHAYTERPSIRLQIPSLAPQIPAPTPLSPLAFNIPGPRELRKRRETALSRRMTELGFVESPRTPLREQPAPPSASPAARSSPLAAHERSFSLSSVHSEGDAERDVVLLVDCDSDDEEDQHCEESTDAHEDLHEHEHEHGELAPLRSESRQAMLTLFPEPAGAASSIMGNGVHYQRHVDIRVEVVTQEAVARTKRRFSRKWIRERKGKRYTAQDFQEVISELRKLR